MTSTTLKLRFPKFRVRTMKPEFNLQCTINGRGSHVPHRQGNPCPRPSLLSGGLTDLLCGEKRANKGVPLVGCARRTGLARAGKGRIRPLTFPDFLEVRAGAFRRVMLRSVISFGMRHETTQSRECGASCSITIFLKLPKGRAFDMRQRVPFFLRDHQQRCA